MSIHEGDMRPSLASIATIVSWMLAAATPATAGYWNYGCKGNLGGSAYVFDRNSFLIMPKPLAEGDIAGLVKGDVFSFDADDTSYKSLKTMLEGGIEGRPDNVIFYATSNRRHLLAREMVENERSTAINPGEAVEEKVSLSDRFGLWLGFHRCSQDEYLAMVRGYCGHYGIKLGDEELEREALEWSTTRGSRSGRVAWQFTQELAGRLGVRLSGK